MTGLATAETAGAAMARDVTVREATSPELERWDADVRRFPNARVTHTRAWIESLRASGLGDPLYLRFERDDALVACLPGLLVRVAGFRLFGSPMPGWQTASMGPAFDPAVVGVDALVSELLPFLEDRHGVRHVEFLHPSLDAAAMRRHGFKGESVPTTRAPLFPHDEGRTFAALKDVARRNIRRAERLGLEVRLGLDATFVRDHFAQLREVYHRGGNTIPFTSRRLAEGLTRLDEAHKLLAISVFLPETDVRIATGTFLLDGRELLLWMWAHAPHYRWYRATELLTWRAMQHAIALGCDTFDLMGRGEFKAKFGAVPDITKQRWTRSTSRLLAAGRPLAAVAHRAKQVVLGRLTRTGDRMRRRPRWLRGADRRTRAVVMGDVDLVRALGLAGIASTVFARPHDAARYSRHTHDALPWHDPWTHSAAVVQSLLAHSARQEEPPVLFVQDDATLLLVSRERERLARVYRFLLPDAAIVEALVDKSRFQALAARLDLPVPFAQALHPWREPFPTTFAIDGPFVLKPITRRPALWSPLAGDGKALLVESPEALRALWPALAASRLDLIAQTLVPGPESRVESYHCYIDTSGTTVAAFTGRKIRTLPTVFGDSSALEISDAPDVAELGRAIAARLKLRGVAKFDFKRRPDGSLALLEINPRFTLWHHPAARAGVNIPALVFADLTGSPHAGHVPTARQGVRWCKPWTDHRAAREAGISLPRWLSWAIACEAKKALAWDDPMPLAISAVRRWLAAPRRADVAVETGLWT